jgi:hypothetical protein
MKLGMLPYLVVTIASLSNMFDPYWRRTSSLSIVTAVYKNTKRGSRWPPRLVISNLVISSW